MAIQFKKATKKNAWLRMAIIGPSGSGKTYSGLSIGRHLGARIAVIDTERGSASKYSDLFDFDVLELESFHPAKYIEAIRAAEAAGYDLLIIDSLSHAWMGKDGALELVDRAAKKNERGNSFSAWRDVTPLHNQLVDAILNARLHVIVTMRSKQEYVQEKDEKTGRTSIRKIGLQPVQRDGMEYEFDVTADMNMENEMLIGKSRCPALRDCNGGIIARPGAEVARVLVEWLRGTESEPADSETPPADNADEENPYIPEADTLGVAIYGDEWASKRIETARWISQGSVEYLEDLKPYEMGRVIAMLRKRHGEMQAKTGQPPQQEDPFPDGMDKWGNDVPPTTPPATPPTSGDKRLISPKQAGRFRAISRVHSWKERELQRLLAERRIASVEAITRDQYEVLCGFLTDESKRDAIRRQIDQEDVAGDVLKSITT